MSTAKIISAIALLGKAIGELGDALNNTAFGIGVPSLDAGASMPDAGAKVNGVPTLAAAPADAPYPTGGWITNRRPNADDADEHGKVWVIDDETGNVIAGQWDGSSVENDMPWRPIERPSVYDAGWIGNRIPTLADTGGYGKVWAIKGSEVIMAKYDGRTVRSASWMPINRPASPWTEAQTRERLAAINN